MAFVRTVTGDVDPADLGITYAHEHLVIDPGRATQLEPDFELSDVDRMATEVRAAATLGLQAAVDAMPCDTGRNAAKLAELSRRTGVRIVAPTGLHHERFYGAAHWSHDRTAEELADLFVADIEDGIDAHDYGGPVVRRTDHQAGVIKVGGSSGTLSARDRRVFEATAIAHRRTGAPILTHCDGGTAGLEQIALLTARGVEARHIVLSHVDKVVDRGYHRDLLATGAFLEYDGSFRWGDRPNGTLRLLTWLAEDGGLDQVVLGMDAARQGYYTVYGGTPGLGWLLDGFSARMEAAGLGDADRRRLFVANPARAFAFRVDDGGTA
jgi:5-phospho-D-xylono-1,4-lactonase